MNLRHLLIKQKCSQLCGSTDHPPAKEHRESTVILQHHHPSSSSSFWSIWHLSHLSNFWGHLGSGEKESKKKRATCSHFSLHSYKLSMWRVEHLILVLPTMAIMTIENQKLFFFWIGTYVAFFSCCAATSLNQFTHDCMLHVVWAPSRKYVTLPRNKVWVRPSHSVSARPMHACTHIYTHLHSNKLYRHERQIFLSTKYRAYMMQIDKYTQIFKNTYNCKLNQN